MIPARGWLCGLGAVVIAQHFCLASAAAAELRHDVFARPALAGAQPSLLAPSRSTTPAEAAPVWRAELRAVVVAGRDSLANVDGIIVRIGGDIDGFRLVAVREREAVFVKDKQRYTLALRAVRSADAAQGSQGISSSSVINAAPDAASAGSMRAADAAQEPRLTGTTTIPDSTTRGPQ